MKAILSFLSLPSLASLQIWRPEECSKNVGELHTYAGGHSNILELVYVREDPGVLQGLG